MTEKEIYARCLGHRMTHAGAAGCTANILAESAGRPNNVEDRSGISDEVYTAGVDNGTYGNFTTDRYGYGLCQWTLPSRKQALLTFMKVRGVSIGDGQTQMLYLRLEMQQSYSAVWNLLVSTSDPYEAGYTMCKKFEIPANTEQTSRVRGNRAVEIYNRCCGTEPIDPGDKPTPGPTPKPDYHYHKTTYKVEMHLLGLGDYGPEVLSMQGILNAKGFACPVNGEFDAETKAALMDAQRTIGGLAVDGEYGGESMNALLNY